MIFLSSLCNYQRVVKREKTRSLSHIILINSHNPCDLFSTINSVLNTPQVAYYKASAEVCNKFLFLC